MSDSINILLVSKAFESVLFSRKNTSITVFVLICCRFFFVLWRVFELWALWIMKFKKKYIYPTSSYGKISLFLYLLLISNMWE